MRDQSMRNRSRVTRFGRTRQSQFVPAVVRYLPALAGENLEDRTLLSGVTDSANCESSWAELLGAETSLSFLWPADAISGWLAMGSGQRLSPLTDSSHSEDVALATFHLRVDAQADWREVMNLSDSGEESPADGTQELVTVKADDEDSPDGAGRFVTITVDFVGPTVRLPEATTNGEPRFDFASGAEVNAPDFSLPISNPLALAKFSAGLSSVAIIGDASGPTAETIAVEHSETDLLIAASMAISTTERVDPPATEFEDVDGFQELTSSELGSLTQPVTLLAIFPSAAGSPSAADAQNTVELAAVLFEPAVLKSFHGGTDSGTAFDTVAIVLLPADGLQAAAAPLMAVVETVLASLDTAARALLAMLTGAGGGTSPIAPVVEPIVSSSPVLIDPKRPRWALHDGMIEELAAYSLVIAPDQHFDLKEFGSAASAADPVIRIEFEQPPQHGQLSAAASPGSFQYSADPGFSGADTARFRITRASGQTVAASVTILVGERDFMNRPAAPVRQVELPILDQRLSLSPSAIDASFGLSDGGMDLP